MALGDSSTRAVSFGAIALDYDRFRPGPPVEAVEWLLGHRRDAAVDIGAGTGALTRELTRFVRHVTAVEPDPRMGSVLMAQVPHAWLLSGRAEELPLRDGSVDAVVGSSMWHWVDEARAAIEVARVLRPGGVLGLLWNGPDRSEVWLAEVLAGPARERAGAVGEDGQLRHRHEVHLPADAPFTDPETRALRWSLRVTPAQLLGLAGTYSQFIVLPEDEKTRHRDRLRDMMLNHPALAGRQEIEMPMRCTCWRAVRRA